MFDYAPPHFYRSTRCLLSAMLDLFAPGRFIISIDDDQVSLRGASEVPKVVLRFGNQSATRLDVEFVNYFRLWRGSWDCWSALT